MSGLNGKKIVIIGAGPNRIGQSGECDEGAIEACRALTSLGCKLIVINSNPDSVVNDGPGSPATHIEPLTPARLEAVIDAERPDALLPIFAGRDGLRLVAGMITELAARRRELTVWGPQPQTLEAIHNRESLQSALQPIQLKTPSIYSVAGVDGAIEKAREIGFPVVLRCDDAHQLPDGTLIYNQDELNDVAASLSGESIGDLTVEASLVDWQQVEIEVLRDRSGKTVIAGCVEYLDTAAVHPGDAVGACPPRILDPAMQARLTKHATAIASHLHIVGSATMRFAHHPAHADPLVLAVHPRYTGASALVSRASGCKVAQCATLLAAGLAWDELPPALAPDPGAETAAGPVAVKYPVWDFEKLESVADRLGPKMQAIGHRIGLGATFTEALQKAARANDRSGSGLIGEAAGLEQRSRQELMAMIGTPTSRRLAIIIAALRKKAAVEDVIAQTHMAAGFIRPLNALADIWAKLESTPLEQLPHELLNEAKITGISDAELMQLTGASPDLVAKRLSALGIVRQWISLPGDHRHQFSTFQPQDTQCPRCPSDRKKIAVIGSGAYTIGNGGEHDYAVYHTARALTDLGHQAIILNNNAVSITTGPAGPAPCYCDPLDNETIVAILQREQVAGAITQLAGPRAHELAAQLEQAGIPAMGTPAPAMALVQDRAGFRRQMKALGIPQPTAKSTDSAQGVHDAADALGYPLSIHGVGPPLSVEPTLIGDASMLADVLATARIDAGQGVRVEQFLEYAIECQAEVLCDGSDARTLAVLEHIELAGVHAGDSACVLPPYSIAPRHMETISAYGRKIAVALGIRGQVNIRLAIYRDTVYVLAAVCGACRNMGLVACTTGLPVAALATRVMMGASIGDLSLEAAAQQQAGVRAPVFPFNVFSDVDPLLGPQMRATGQVLAMDDQFGKAYFKAIAAAGTPLPTTGTVLITVTDEDKASILEPARIFHEQGFNIMATKGTRQTLGENGIEAAPVRKLGFGRPNLVDEIKNGNIQLVINTPAGGQSQIDDSVIRKAAIAYRVANITTPASALAAAKGIAAHRQTAGGPDQQG